MISVPNYKTIVDASDAFLGYLVEHYRDRMDEPLPFDRRPNFALAVCQDERGEWSVCLPMNLGDEEIVECVPLADEGVKTRGDLIAYMHSNEWKEFLRWLAGVDDEGNPISQDEERA